jgi:hypothetical protein
LLTCHPTTPCDAIHRFEVEAHRRADATLELCYTLAGDLDRLLIPPQRAPRRADKLWQHTCFEAFVAVDNAPGYTEFNFAPSSEWAIYRFSAYREGMAVVQGPPPRIRVRRETERLDLDAVVDLAPLRSSSGLRFALCAVVEQADGRLSYWALEHPAGKPDFHHIDGFMLALPGSGSAPEEN